MSTARMDGRVALVTGAGSGLGAAIAARLVEEGARVVCADRDLAAVEAVAADLGEAAVAVACDVTVAADLDAAVARAVDDLGGLDLVVANAGVAGEGKAHELAEEDWRRIVDIHLTGTFLTVKAALPHLMAQGRGALVLQSSISGLAGVPNIPSYTAAKGGIIALGRQLAAEYAASGVRVNVVAPGPIMTPLVRKAFRDRHGDGADEALWARERAVPLGTFGKPADVAAAVAFLGSDDAAWITGVVLPVDGGSTAVAALGSPE